MYEAHFEYNPLQAQFNAELDIPNYQAQFSAGGGGANNGKLTIIQGENQWEFYANQAENTNVNLIIPLNADWNAESGLAQILNKPEIPTRTSQLINNSGYIKGINAVMIKAALGYTPYNESNPAHYIDKDVNNLSNYTLTSTLNAQLMLKANKLIVDNIQNTISNYGDIVSHNAAEFYLVSNPSNFQTQTQMANAIGTSISEHNLSNQSHSDLRLAIADINNIIPNQASISNQLADKNFVNSSIATNTANFLGTFNSVEEMEAYSGTKTNNDYAFVISTDSAGNVIYNRYKWTGTQFLFEYSLNNSSFTANQWEAINSGISTDLVEQISTNANNISDNTSDISALQTSKQDVISDLGTIRTQASTSYNTIQTYGDIVTHDVDEFATATQGAKADTAIQNVKTINNQSIVGTGNIDIQTINSFADITGNPYDNTNLATALNNKQAVGDYATNTALTTGLATKQEILISGTNIKTINNQTLLGSGNIDTTVSFADITGNATDNTSLSIALNNKQNTLKSGSAINIENNIVSTLLYDSSKFTVYGNPTITDDGIASGFSDSNYIVDNLQQYNFVDNVTIRIKFKVNEITSSSDNYLLFTGVGNGYQAIQIFQNGDIVRILDQYFVSSERQVERINFNDIQPNEEFNLKIVLTPTTFSVYRTFDNNTWNLVETKQLAQSANMVNFDGFIGKHSVADHYFIGEIDLKNFSIFIDGIKKIDGGQSIYSALNDKLNTDHTNDSKPYMKTTYTSGTSGYRIWSDGYCVQWGDIPKSTSSITYLKNFADTNYALSFVQIEDTASATFYGFILRTNGFTCASQGSWVRRWQASGYLAAGQY